MLTKDFSSASVVSGPNMAVFGFSWEDCKPRIEQKYLCIAIAMIIEFMIFKALFHEGRVTPALEPSPLFLFYQGTPLTKGYPGAMVTYPASRASLMYYSGPERSIKRLCLQGRVTLRSYKQGTILRLYKQQDFWY
jgi:hypothetical protein